MSFSQKTRIFEHVMTRTMAQNKPILIKIPLDAALTIKNISPLFVVNELHVTAFRGDTYTAAPIKFTLLDSKGKRVLTSDPSALNTKWLPCLETRKAPVDFAGTSTYPFVRNFPPDEEENKQSLINILRFMMSGGPAFAEDAQGALETLAECAESTFRCGVCLATRTCSFKSGPQGRLFVYPCCNDTGECCVPRDSEAPDTKADALHRLMTLMNVAYKDQLPILRKVMEELAIDMGTLPEVDYRAFPPRHGLNFVLSYPLVKYTYDLYQCMLSYAENFAVLRNEEPYVKLLLETPAENVKLIQGSMSISVIYGRSLGEIYISLQPLECHQGEMSDERDEDTALVTDISSQLPSDVVLRKLNLGFANIAPTFLNEWSDFYTG